MAATAAALLIALIVGGGGWTLYQRGERVRLDGVAREVCAAPNQAQVAVSRRGPRPTLLGGAMQPRRLGGRDRCCQPGAAATRRCTAKSSRSPSS